MSEFDEAMSEALGEAIGFIGSAEFQIGNRIYTGDLSELGQQTFAIVIGGKETIITATLIAPIGQFAGQLPADNTRLRVKSRWWKVASKSTDAISGTMNLTDPDAH